MSFVPEAVELPATITSLVSDLHALGVNPGMSLLVHASFKSLGFVSGGAPAVILALEEALGSAGTLMMPTFTADISEPANWQHPPVPEAWWEILRATMPAYDPALTPTYYMGIIAETFRKQTGVLRSSNPDASFAAWGAHAHALLAEHALCPLFGEGSPVARLYEREGWVLLLGVGHDRNTSLHLAEARAAIPHRTIRLGSPMLVDGMRQWAPFDDIDWDDSDFPALGADFERESGLLRRGKVARAEALLMPQRALVDYGVAWLERHRR